ncbi:MAG TPA: hypothetical protein VMH32_21685 [Burkholderiales bacterium]|nr:hypothetical protein [Burkholderiales bacterium]
MLSFAKDIKPLFRPKDVEAMKPLGLDLSSYEDVRSSAEAILSRLEDGSMPCDGRWQKASVDEFRQWIQDGKRP